jgi:hypothetical protein
MRMECKGARGRSSNYFRMMILVPRLFLKNMPSSINMLVDVWMARMDTLDIHLAGLLQAYRYRGGCDKLHQWPHD